MKLRIIIFAMWLFHGIVSAQEAPLRVGVAGLTHDHVNWILGRPDKGDVKLVGIAESDQELVKRYAAKYSLPPSLFYNSLEEMIAGTMPEAVAAFGSIYQHIEVVKACAPKGIHVMAEKPLAVNLDHAKQMQQLATQHSIQLLTNFETTWYATNQTIKKMVAEKKLGTLRKVVVHDGHNGPKEIGVSKEFFGWLTDPKQNGGGAIIDFGCYGANLVTWLTNGERPISVLALTQQLKPLTYPNVDDEATILVEYPTMVGIIQASWNWPFGRKDMEVYGATGYAIADNRSKLRTRLEGEDKENMELFQELKAPYDDPFSFLAAVVRKKITLPKNDLSSLENNMLVVEILEAALQSTRTGKKVLLTK